MYRVLSSLMRNRILVGSTLATLLAVSGVADATLEGLTFTSADGFRLTLPRGWRASEQPTFPGVLLWLRWTRPSGVMLLSSDQLTDERYCSWPQACRDAGPDLAQQYACVLGQQLSSRGFKVGPTQMGPKAELSSVWFEFENPKRFLRQAVIADDPMLYTLVLSSSSSADRAQHARILEQVLRSARRVALDDDDKGENAPASSPRAKPISRACSRVSAGAARVHDRFQAKCCDVSVDHARPGARWWVNSRLAAKRAAGKAAQ